MNDEELDDRIRSLVASAVADTPAPRPFPAALPLALMAPTPRRHRGLVLAGLGIAASVLAVALFWSAKNDNQRVIPATSPDVTSTSTDQVSADWPTDLAVIVANDRGVEQIGPDGKVQTVLHVAGIALAYELADGSLIYQKGALKDELVVGGGDIMWRSADGAEAYSLVTAGDTSLQLFDASLVDGELGRLQLVYGYVGSGPATVGSWFQPGEPHNWLPEGGWAVGYRRWSIAGADRVLAGWIDDTLKSNASMHTATGEVVNAGDRFVGALRVVAAPDGRTGRLDDDGMLTLFAPNGEVSTVKVPNAEDVVDLQLRGAALVVNYATSRRALLIDLRTGAEYDVPANGYVTPSMSVNAEMPPSTEISPVGDVRAILSRSIAGSDGGVWAVTDSAVTKVASGTDGPAFLVGDSLVYSPEGGGVVLQSADSSTTLLRTTGVVRDAAMFSGQLFYLYTDWLAGDEVSLYLHGPSGETYIAVDSLGDTGHTSWHLGRDAIVGTGAYYAGMAPEIYDHAGNALTEQADLAAPANRDALTGNMIVYTMSAGGLWGSLDGDTLTLRQWGSSEIIESITVPDRTIVSSIDVADSSVLVTSENSVKLATKGANGQWSWETLEDGDWATLPRADDPGAAPQPATTPSAPDAFVALAGSFGVSVVEGPNTTAISTSPSDRVVWLANGSVAYRSPSEGGYPRLWERSTGESNELWAAVDWIAEPMLHDDMRGNGNFLFTVGNLLYDYQAEVRRTLATAPAGRLSYSSNGWIVGENVRYSIGDTQPPAWMGGAGLWALSPAGDLVASYVDGVVQVRRVSDARVVYERAAGEVDVTEIDVNNEWVSIAETPIDTPNADSTSRVVLVHLASGRSHAYEGALSASLPDTSL